MLRLVLVSVCLVGCVTSSKGRKMERDILALQAQFDALQMEKEKLQTTLEESRKALAEIDTERNAAREANRRNQANFGAELDALKREVQRLHGSYEETRHLLGKMKGEVSKLATEPKAPVGPPPLPAERDELYAYGYQAMKNGTLPEALRAFKAYHERHPQDKRADNALYFSGDILKRQKKYVDSVMTLQGILDRYPDGDKVDEAYFGMGQCFEALGKCEDALVFYKDLVKKQPKSPLVPEVKARLKKGCE